jgi:hypothetical protein
LPTAVLDAALELPLVPRHRGLIVFSAGDLYHKWNRGKPAERISDFPPLEQLDAISLRFH